LDTAAKKTEPILPQAAGITTGSGSESASVQFIADLEKIKDPALGLDERIIV
jgi:hypothetical protein